MTKRIWIMAGESSGDDYGAQLSLAFREHCPGCIIRGMGGEKMANAGVDCFIDSSELGIVGLVETLRHLPRFIGLFRLAVHLAREERPDLVVMIDYPGFNMRLGKRLHAMGIPVVWYISPQVWAWKSRRVFTLEKCVDLMLCIFPFEPECYARTSLRAEFVGHPLLQSLAPYMAKRTVRSPNRILILPGSRRSELTRLLPDFVRTALLLHKANPSLEFDISLPRESTLALARDILSRMELPPDAPEFRLSFGNTRQLMTECAAGMAACGTVTVEAAILDLPLVVAYRLNRLTWWLGRLLVKLPYITIANLICNRCVYQEFLQDNATAENMAPALAALLPGGERHDETLVGLEETRRRLGGQRDVAAIVAEKAISLIQSQEDKLIPND